MHGGVTAAYTVPDGYVAVIRNITAVNTNGVGIPEYGQVYLGHSSCTIFLATISPFLPSSGTQQITLEYRVVVEATDTINVQGGADVDMTVNGYLLKLP